MNIGTEHDHSTGVFARLFEGVGMISEIFASVTAVLVLTVVIFLFKTVALGRKNRNENLAHVAAHKKSANHTIGVTFLLIMVVELFAHTSTVHMTDTIIFHFHITFATLFLLALLVMRFWQTGLVKKELHAYLGYTAVFSFAVMLSTGVFMMASILAV